MSTSAPPPPAPQPQPARAKRRRGPLALLALLLLAGAGVGGYFAYTNWKARQRFEQAVAANLRGVGHMDRHDFPPAEAEFRKAVELAPDWLPARINLGISMFNQQPADSKTLTQHVEESRDVFREVLRRDPQNLHARFCLGTLDLYVGKIQPAFEHFAAVYELDPNDPHVLVRYATVLPDAQGGPYGPLARECYEKALKLDPYFNEARFRLAHSLRDIDEVRRRAIFVEHDQLQKADQYTESRIVYSEMGKYADVIGRDNSFRKPRVGRLPMFAPTGQVTLAPGTRWAAEVDLDALTRAARERFGAGVVMFDFDGDDKPDVLALSAGVRDGKLCDLLLKNEGNGTFTDASTALGTSRASLGAAPADYDNDGHPDLALTGAFGVRLLRNTGKGTFEDVSAATGLDKLTGLFLGCGWYDFDPDGDLDLVLCKFSDSVAALDAKQAGGTVLLFENVGVAPPSLPNAPNPALSTAFKRNDVFAPLVPAGAYVAFVASDLDGDSDTDLLLLADGAEPVFIENDRLMRFKRPQPAWVKHTGAWTGGLVFDANRDERSDLLLARAGAAPVLLLSTGERDFTASEVNAPAFRQATAADIDADGWADVVGLTAEDKPVLLHNQGDGKLAAKTDAFGILKDVRALAVANVISDGNLDLLALTDAGVQLHTNNGNGNRTLFLTPTGKRNKGKNERTSNDGLGTRISAHAGTHWTAAERATATAGPAQSLLPTALGMGKHAKADLVRLQWPDLVLQAELGIDTGRAVRVEETNRKGTSCPVLMVWDGEKFAFVTDFLGGGALGESGPDGSIRPPRREESVKIEPGKLVPRNGEYVLKIAEPMDEVLYLDHLKLIAIDHPAGTAVFPDERFVFALPNATEKLMAFGTKHFPKRATDTRGADVTARVLTRDRHAVDTFAVRSWLGYAEDHSLTLDFGDIPEGRDWALVLAGWTEYPYPESMFAATRAGVNIVPPVLERRTPGGKWETVCDLGFPAGLPRTMTRPLPAGFKAGACELRIRTNMQVFWDQIYLAQSQPVTNPVELGVKRADLAARGFMQEVYPDGKPPVAYDDAKTEPVLVAKWKGQLTKLGDVTELLTADDDRYVLCGPGDEITVRFDATKLPAVPAGFERSFVLKTRGYCKDTSSTTVTGMEVGPLPFRAMPNYPHFGVSVPPRTDAEKWHTRPAGR